MKESITISIESELKNSLDQRRGLVTRSRYIESLIAKGINERPQAPDLTEQPLSCSREEGTDCCQCQAAKIGIEQPSELRKKG